MRFTRSVFARLCTACYVSLDSQGLPNLFGSPKADKALVPLPKGDEEEGGPAQEQEDGTEAADAGAGPSFLRRRPGQLVAQTGREGGEPLSRSLGIMKRPAARKPVV